MTAVTGSTFVGSTGGTTPAISLNATGTPSSATFLRGDNTWNTPAGGGGSSSSGTAIQLGNGAGGFVQYSGGSCQPQFAMTGITNDGGLICTAFADAGSYQVAGVYLGDAGSAGSLEMGNAGGGLMAYLGFSTQLHA